MQRFVCMWYDNCCGIFCHYGEPLNNTRRCCRVLSENIIITTTCRISRYRCRDLTLFCCDICMMSKWPSECLNKIIILLVYILCVKFLFKNNPNCSWNFWKRQCGIDRNHLIMGTKSLSPTTCASSYKLMHHRLFADSFQDRIVVIQLSTSPQGDTFVVGCCCNDGSATAINITVPSSRKTYHVSDRLSNTYIQQQVRMNDQNHSKDRNNDDIHIKTSKSCYHFLNVIALILQV